MSLYGYFVEFGETFQQPRYWAEFGENDCNDSNVTCDMFAELLIKLIELIR